MEAAKQNNVTIHRDAISISLDHPTSGYGYFTMASNGTLSIQTDYGSYDALWRGQFDMVKFLSGNSVEYVMNNIERSFRNQVSRKKPESIPQFHYKHLETLVGYFIEALKGLPTSWVLKRTECLQPKDGQEVVTGSCFLKKLKVEDETWYIYYDPGSSCFLTALDNNPKSVFCIPNEVAIKYL